MQQSSVEGGITAIECGVLGSLMMVEPVRMGKQAIAMTANVQEGENDYKVDLMDPELGTLVTRGG
jgi:hypothetical protein